MVAVRGALYAVEPNHGEVDRVSQDGSISRVVDVSASQGHIVPTAIGYLNRPGFRGGSSDWVSGGLARL